MTIVLYIGMSESKHCYYDGEFPKLAANYRRYYDDCKIKSTYGRSFRTKVISDDALYNLFVANAVNNYSKIIFTDVCYNQVFKCSKTTITLRNVIDRLLRDYPNIVLKGEYCGTVPKYPLKIDSLESSIIGTKIQLKINVSGDLPGRARIIWGSLANSEIVTINPTEIRSVTYEKSMSPGEHTICVSEVT